MFKTFKQFNLFTKAALIIGLLLIVYGYLCRLLQIFFFWESRSAGWMLLMMGIIGFLFYRIKIQKTIRKKAIPEKIGIGILAFILAVQLILMAVIPNTNAYAAAKIFLMNDADLTSEIGAVKGFGLIPLGSIQITDDASGESGSAVISLTVKGEKRYKDIVVCVTKTPDKPDWEVEEVEPEIN